MGLFCPAMTVNVVHSAFHHNDKESVAALAAVRGYPAHCKDKLPKVLDRYLILIWWWPLHKDHARPHRLSRQFIHVISVVNRPPIIAEGSNKWKAMDSSSPKQTKPEQTWIDRKAPIFCSFMSGFLIGEICVSRQALTLANYWKYSSTTLAECPRIRTKQIFSFIMKL